MVAVAEPEDAAPLTGESTCPTFSDIRAALVSRVHRSVGTVFVLRHADAACPVHGQVSSPPRHVEHVVAFDSIRKFYPNLDGQALASQIFGNYTALVYLTPILGGLIATGFSVNAVPC